MQIQLQTIENACSNSTCSEDFLSESEPEASQRSISESIETQRTCSDSDPQSVQSSSTSEITKENSFYSGTRNSAVIDGRITDDKLPFTIKWEKRFTWAYSSYHASWFWRTCQEYYNSHDQYWKTVPRTHDQHPGVFFQSTKTAKTTLELSLIKVTSRNYWLQGTLFVR